MANVTLSGMRRRMVPHQLVRALLTLVLVGVGVQLPTAATSAGPVAASAPRTHALASLPALPVLHNISTPSDSRAQERTTEALSGLGFAPDDPKGPQPSDRVVVTNNYVAWLDETGFYGKLNGLWWLAPTTSGDSSFSHRDTD